MLLTTTTIAESNRDFMRILMTGFYTSSDQARELYKLVEKYSSGSADRKSFHLQQAWDKVSHELDAGPLPQFRHAALVEATEKNADAHFRMMAKDTKSRFFAHLISFVRDLNLQQHGNVRLSNCLKGKFTFEMLAASDEFNVLRQAIKGRLPELVKDLGDPKIQDIILTDFTPAKVAFNVVPIRPDIVVVDPNVAVVQEQQVAQTQEEPPPPPKPPAVQVG